MEGGGSEEKAKKINEKLNWRERGCKEEQNIREAREREKRRGEEGKKKGKYSRDRINYGLTGGWKGKKGQKKEKEIKQNGIKNNAEKSVITNSIENRQKRQTEIKKR